MSGSRSHIKPGTDLVPHAARATATVGPAVAGAATYGVHVEDQLTSAAAEARRELETTAAQAQADFERAATSHREALQAEGEAQLAALRQAGEALRTEVTMAQEHLQELTRVLVERVEGATFEARNDLHRLAARVRGEGEERLDRLEDHLRAGLDRLTAEVERATQEAVAQIQATVDRELRLHHRGPDGVQRHPAESPIYLSPDQVEDDDVDLG